MLGNKPIEERWKVELRINVRLKAVQRVNWNRRDYGRGRATLDDVRRAEKALADLDGKVGYACRGSLEAPAQYGESKGGNSQAVRPRRDQSCERNAKKY